MIRCALKGVGLAAPGLPAWSAAAPVLAGTVAYLPPDPAAPVPPYAPALLPQNERRRATAAVRQAFRAAEDAMQSGEEPRRLASVFASSDADLGVLHRICCALADPARAISPTDFHNSVHNAASGYWSIAVQSIANTTTLAAYDASFTAGLLEAAALAADPGTDADVLLVTYDAVAPAPLLAKRPLAVSASVALVLGREGPAPFGTLDIDVGGTAAETVCTRAPLEGLRTGNPALRALPLLELVAARCPGAVTLRGTGDLHITVSYSP